MALNNERAALLRADTAQKEQIPNMSSIPHLVASNPPKPLTPSDLEELRLRQTLLESKVPAHLHGGLVDYLVHHVRPGSYLTPVLSNDLIGAVSRGDDDARASLAYTVLWLLRYAQIHPKQSWGSEENVVAWLSKAAG